jgi:hypothetical protein
VVKVTIEAHDLGDSMKLHYCDVNCIAGSQVGMREHDLPCTLHCQEVHWEYFVDDPKKHLEAWLDRFSPTDGPISMQDLLKDLGICHEAASLADETLQQSSGIDLVWMLAADEVHGYVRVDQDHEFPP